MSLHSYSRCWVHLIWGTLHRERLVSKESAGQMSQHQRLRTFAEELTEFIERNGLRWNKEESR
jgi:hypothetical protein